MPHPRLDHSEPEVVPAGGQTQPPGVPVSGVQAGGTREKRRSLLGFALCLAGLAIGFYALRHSPAASIGRYGLIQALSPLYYVALLLLIISFAWSLRAKWHRSALLGTHLAFLVFLVHGAPGMIEAAPRFATAYLHVGFVGYIANTGTLLQNYDARFSWPSFFEAVAMLDKVAGVGSADVFLRWWPVAMNLIYVALIFGIAKGLLRSELKAWVAAGLFPLANWVGQDYFSPQSTGYLLYLAFLYILIVPLGARDRPVWQSLFHRRRVDPGPGQQAQPDGLPPQGRESPRAVGFYLGVLVLLMAAMATGHQLTPIMAIISTIVLVAAGRTRVRGVAVVVPLMAIGWICYGAVTFWSGHIGMLVGGFGHVGGNVGSAVVQRVTGNPAHEHIVDIRLLTAAFVWGLALLGALTWRSRNGDRAVVLLLFLGSFCMIAGGNYGGEGMLRIYLFSLPPAVCLIAALIFKLPRFWQGQVALGCALLLLTPLFLLARWGNELYEMARPGELAAVTKLQETAAPDSSLVSLNGFIAWKYTNILEFQYLSMDVQTLGSQTLSQVTAMVDNNPRGGYVIITADQTEYGWLAYGLPRDWGTTVERMLAHSPNYKLIIKNPDAEVFQYIPHPAVKAAGKK